MNNIHIIKNVNVIWKLTNFSTCHTKGRCNTHDTLYFRLFSIVCILFHFKATTKMNLISISVVFIKLGLSWSISDNLGYKEVPFDMKYCFVTPTLIGIRKSQTIYSWGRNALKSDASKLNDVPCTNKIHFVCEKRISKIFTKKS